MAIKPEVLDALVAAGATAEMISAAVKADQAKSSGARRQAAYRERKASRVTSHNVTDITVTSRDGDTLPSPSPDGSPKDNNQTPSLTPSSPNPTSLRSVGAKAVRVKARSQIAEDEQPDEIQRRDATEHGLSPTEFREQWAKFRDHHRAKGSQMADWRAAWRTWLRGIPQFQPRAGPRPEKPKIVNPFLAAGLKMMADIDAEIEAEKNLKMIGESNGSGPEKKANSGDILDFCDYGPAQRWRD